jgi:iron-sulfur cluster assembly protein
MENKMGIELTTRAILEVKKVREEQELGDSSYLRVGIEGGGCAGFSYKLTFEEDQIDALNDRVYEFDGIKAVVDRKSELYLDGTTIDFYEGLDQRGFKFDNPNATRGCGCGKSFNA